MKYFLANLLVHLVISAFLVITIVVITNKNKNRKTKSVFYYFVPILLSLIALFYCLNWTAPRLLDTYDVITQNYYTSIGTITNKSSMNNTFEIDGKIFFINPLRDLPPEGTLVRIRYTKYSNYVIGVTPSDLVDVDEYINNEFQTAVITGDN